MSAVPRRIAPCSAVRAAACFLLAAALLPSLRSSAPSEETRDPYLEALRYKVGQPTAPLAAIEAEIRAAEPEDLPPIEARLLEILRSPAATTDGKDWACRQLRLVGSEAAAADLAALLAHGELHTVARLALQSIPGAQVDGALRKALPGLSKELQVGAVLTIGARRDLQAVPLLASLAGDANLPLSEAALYALGHIGGGEALRILEALKVSPELERYRLHAILLCAERWADEGRSSEAEAVYRRLYETAGDSVIRIGALRGIVQAAKAKAATAVVAALREEDPALRAAAAKFACEDGGPELLATALADLASLPPESQALLLGLVDDRSALPALLAAVRDGAPSVRVAALHAIGRAGDASCVGPLLEIAAAGPGEAPEAARRSLASLRRGDVEAALEAAIRDAAAEGNEGRSVRTQAIRALSARGAASSAGALLEAARDPEPTIQMEAFAALGSVADAAALPDIVKMVSEGGSSAAVAAALSTCRRLENKDDAARVVIAALPGPNAKARCALLSLLSGAACPRALGALRNAISEPDPTVVEAAVRALADWPDPSAMGDLVDAARSSRAPGQREAALGGLARLGTLPGGAPEEKVEHLSEGLKLASEAAGRKALVSALASIEHPAALDLAVSLLADPELEVDAAVAVVKIAKGVRKVDPRAADGAVQKILEICRSPTARAVAESAAFVPADWINIAPRGTASSPDGIEKDGAAGGDQAAIDGDPNTYWDEEDGRALYRLEVTLPQPRKVVGISILGYEHHRFAPKDFEILCDGVVVRKVEGAQYDGNFLVIRLDGVSATKVELRITGAYGGSPAIRELGIWRPGGGSR